MYAYDQRKHETTRGVLAAEMINLLQFPKKNYHDKIFLMWQYLMKISTTIWFIALSTHGVQMKHEMLPYVINDHFTADHAIYV